MFSDPYISGAPQYTIESAGAAPCPKDKRRVELDGLGLSPRTRKAGTERFGSRMAAVPLPIGDVMKRAQVVGRFTKIGLKMVARDFEGRPHRSQE